MKTKIPSLTALKKRTNSFRQLCDARGLSGLPVKGKARETLISSILRFIEHRGDFDPGVDEIGDYTVVDEKNCDEDFLAKLRKDSGRQE